MHDFWAMLRNTTFACKSWSDYQLASYVFFFLKNKIGRILYPTRAGRKYREISRKIGKNTDKYRNIGDIFENYRNFRRPIIGDEYCVGAGG